MRDNYNLNMVVILYNFCMEHIPFDMFFLLLFDLLDILNILLRILYHYLLKYLQDNMYIYQNLPDLLFLLGHMYMGMLEVVSLMYQEDIFDKRNTFLNIIQVHTYAH